MLAMGRAMMSNPRYLLLDEPSLGLAPLIVDQIMGLFAELRRRGSALLLVEEKARDVLAIADTVAFLSLGRVTWVGPRAEVDERRVAEAYLGASMAGAIPTEIRRPSVTDDTSRCYSRRCVPGGDATQGGIDEAQQVGAGGRARCRVGHPRCRMRRRR